MRYKINNDIMRTDRRGECLLQQHVNWHNFKGENSNGKIYITKRHLSWKRMSGRTEEPERKMKAVLVVGGGSMKRQGFLDKAVNY